MIKFTYLSAMRYQKSRWEEKKTSPKGKREMTLHWVWESCWGFNLWRNGTVFVQDMKEKERSGGGETAQQGPLRSIHLILVSRDHPPRPALFILSWLLCWATLLLHLFTLYTNYGDCPEGGPAVGDSLHADQRYKNNATARLTRKVRSEKKK